MSGSPARARARVVAQAVLLRALPILPSFHLFPPEKAPHITLPPRTMTPPTILCTRPLPPPGADLLAQVHSTGLARVIQWEEDSQCPREWVLEHIKKGGVNALVIMLGDKVSGALVAGECAGGR